MAYHEELSGIEQVFSIYVQIAIVHTHPSLMARIHAQRAVANFQNGVGDQAK